MFIFYNIQKSASLHYLALEPLLAKALMRNDNKRVLCTINKTIVLHAAILKRKDGLYYIMLGTSLMKQHKWKVGQSLAVVIEIDTANYQFEMPLTLKEVLATDPDAAAIFQQLSAGNQRSLMYLVTIVKSTDKQIERALKIAAQLKLGISSAREILK